MPNYQDYVDKAITAVKSGDWNSAIKYGRIVPKSWDIWSQMPSAAWDDEKMDSTLSDEAIHSLLQEAKKAGSKESFLFELANTLPKNAGFKILETLADEGKEDGVITEAINEHPNFKLSPEKQGIKDVSDFWTSYERSVSPHHFATVKSFFTGKPETVKYHRVDEAIPDEGSSNNYMHLIPHMANYGKEIHKAVLDQAKENGHEIKYIKGKPHIKVYRGVGGDYAAEILKAINHDPTTGEIDKKTVKLPVSPLTSWTTDTTIAHRFATHRAESINPNNKKSVVFEKWLPVEDILHSGQHTVISNQEHPHSEEAELIFGHKDPHIKLPSTSIHILEEPKPEEGFVYPWNSKKGIPRNKKSEGEIVFSDLILSKAIADIPEGKVITHHPESGVATYDYSHLLSPKSQSEYKLILRVIPRVKSINVHVEPIKGGDPVGQFTGNWHEEKGQTAVTPHEVLVDDNHRRKGLGVAMYEAAYSHASKHFGATVASGGIHSTSAMKLHSKIARKHGLGYKPEPAYGRGSLYPNKESWSDFDAIGDYDGRYHPYSYEIK